MRQQQVWWPGGQQRGALSASGGARRGWPHSGPLSAEAGLGLWLLPVCLNGQYHRAPADGAAWGVRRPPHSLQWLSGGSSEPPSWVWERQVQAVAAWAQQEAVSSGRIAVCGLPLTVFAPGTSLRLQTH